MAVTMNNQANEPLQKNINWGHIFLHLGLIAGSLVMLLPFFWMLVTSLKSGSEISTLNILPYEDIKVEVEGYDRPLQLYKVTMEDGSVQELAQVRKRGRDQEIDMVDPNNPGAEIIISYEQEVEVVKRINIQWSNYYEAWTALPFDRYYLNSIIVAVSVTAIQLLIASLAAFAFARLQFFGRNTLFTLYLATLMIPFPVLLIPNFIMVTQYLGWYDTYQALILPPAFSAFSTFLLRQHYLNLPMELDDAARIDGAGSLYIWLRIVLPMSGATLAALAIFIFLGSWNSFLWPLVVVPSEEMKTVPIGLNSFQGQFGVRWNLLMAAAVVAMAPVLTIYIFAQKWFIRGIALTGISGR